MAGLKPSDRASSRNKPTNEAPPSVQDNFPALPAPPNPDQKFTPIPQHPFPPATHTTNSIANSLSHPLPLPLPLPFHPLHQERSYLLTSLQHADSTATHLVCRLAQTQTKLDRLLSPSPGPSHLSKRGAKSIPHLKRQHAKLKRRLKEAENEEKVILAELGRVVGKIQRVERWVGVGVRAGPASGRRCEGVDERMAALTLSSGPGFEVHHFRGATRTCFPVQVPQLQPTVIRGGGGGVSAPPGAYWPPPSSSPSYNATYQPEAMNHNAHHIYAHEPVQQIPYPPLSMPLSAIQEEEVGATAPLFELDGCPHEEMRISRGSASPMDTNAERPSIVAILLERAEKEGQNDLPLKSMRSRTKSWPVLDCGGYMEGEGMYMGYGFLDGNGGVGICEGEVKGRWKGKGRMGVRGSI